MLFGDRSEKLKLTGASAENKVFGSTSETTSQNVLSLIVSFELPHDRSGFEFEVKNFLQRRDRVSSTDRDREERS
jgi:hypothetical protein